MAEPFTWEPDKRHGTPKGTWGCWILRTDGLTRRPCAFVVPSKDDWGFACWEVQVKGWRDKRRTRREAMEAAEALVIEVELAHG